MFWRTTLCAAALVAMGIASMAYADAGKWTSPMIERGNSLIGLSVRTPGGDELGRLGELVFAHGRLAYSVLVFDKIDEIKDKFLLVPWGGLRLVSGEPRHFTLDITRERLIGAPSFTWDKCPELHKPDVAKAIHEYYGVKFKPRLVEGTGKEFCTLRCVVGTRVNTVRGEGVGHIENLLIDLHKGHLAYGLVSLGGIADVSDKLCVVPWSAIEALPMRGLARVDTDLATLRANAFAWGSFPNLNDLAVASATYQRFNREPYWEVYGYMADRYAAWQVGSTYNRLFDSGKVITCEGVIKSVGTFLPGLGAAGGMRLVLKTDDNRFLTIHLGPCSYVYGAGFRFCHGDRIKLTGSTVTWDGYPIVMAIEVHFGDKVLRLRDAQGVPLWRLGEEAREG
ncbi:MAG: PRC-barrel domain containing protein [Planctomycetes bacterium]|nr:PRC-barrel domain containing protein [Planctomycetota bacterium]